MTTSVARIYIPDRTTVYLLPLFLVPVSAGFPSPADDYLEGNPCHCSYGPSMRGMTGGSDLANCGGNVKMGYRKYTHGGLYPSFNHIGNGFVFKRELWCSG